MSPFAAGWLLGGCENHGEGPAAPEEHLRLAVKRGGRAQGPPTPRHQEETGKVSSARPPV